MLKFGLGLSLAKMNPTRLISIVSSPIKVVVVAVVIVVVVVIFIILVVFDKKKLGSTKFRR